MTMTERYPYWTTLQAGAHSWWWCVTDGEDYYLFSEGGWVNGSGAQQTAERHAAALNKAHPVPSIPDDAYVLEQAPWQQALL